MPKRDKNIPSDWKRVHLKHHPPTVMVLSIPIYGTSWHQRNWRYWTTRSFWLAVAAVMVILQLVMYKSILVDDPNTTHFGAEWWGVTAFGVFATAEGLWVGFVGRRLPFRGLGRRLPKIVTYPFDILLVLNFFAFVFLAPGIFLTFALDSLRPTPYAERIARDDLADQLGVQR
ncbi:hypothetical protein [Kitasatospora sp. NBC_01302]|uniref:hypothetical protein n=1 Tax=Kitasatospora sp. NBC_01302 TaxID=2903575 RepID=UPI002E0E40A5|nr:hypothetical protein OG294_24195 [Kitasatospora sp. NBC_01302]